MDNRHVGYVSLTATSIHACLTDWTKTKQHKGIKEMAQPLRVLATLAEDLASVSGTRMAAVIPVLEDAMSSFKPLLAQLARDADTHIK